MNIRAAVFDVYGTLLEVGPPPPDAEARWTELSRGLRQAEPRLTRLEFSVACSRVIARHHARARSRGIPWPEVHWPSVVAEVLPEFTGWPGARQEEFLLRQIQTGHTTSMTAETVATLRWLRTQGCRLGVASNAQAYTLHELGAGLAAHGAGLDWFDPALCFWSFEHGFSKPDPHVFQTLAARLAGLGIVPGETLMVGDRLDNDIGPARAQGWQVWALGTQAGQGWAGLREALVRSVPVTA